MATDIRNFRSGYYGKVGCDSVEEKKSLNKLLSDNVRNHAKLKQFCLNYTVPTAQRTLLWNIIMGIHPLHKNSTEYILEIRKIIYEDLHKAAIVMQAVDQNSPKHKVMLAMWLIENNRLLHPQAGKGCKEDDNLFTEIVKVLIEIFDDNFEVYWIAKEFYLLARKIKQDCPSLKEITQAILKREDVGIHNHLERIGAYSCDVIDKWYSFCFAGIISETSLIKIWDKICGGSRKIVIFVLLAMIGTFREKILKCSSAKEFKEVIEQLKDPDAIIVYKALKTWQSNMNHSEVESKTLQ